MIRSSVEIRLKTESCESSDVSAMSCSATRAARFAGRDDAGPYSPRDD